MRSALLVLGWLLPIACHAQWTDASGRPLPDRENMRSAGDFGVQLIVTPDGEAFRKTWNASKAAPTLRSTDKCRRGSSISAMVVFYGCAAGTSGRCDVVADFALVTPDGTRSSAGQGPIWEGPPLAGKLQLGHASVKVGFGAHDATGNYQLIATIRDRVSGKNLTLAAPFTVD